MPIIPNPTPPDPVDELPDAFDPLDINHDGIVDEDEAFVSDGTGLHPTRTTFAETTIMVSPTYGPEKTVPTSQSYHVPFTNDEMIAYNKAVGESLSFNDTSVSQEWGAYGPRPDYVGRKWSDGTDMLDVWVDGFVPRYSWDWESPITGNGYANICPTIIFATVGGFIVDSKPSYYFFVEVYNDFQAYHGYSNYSYAKDGYPAINWPGMVKVVHSNFGLSQRPRERVTYENWFDTTYGNRWSYAAPVTLKETRISTSTIPTRFRQLHPTESDIGPRDVQPEPEKAPAPPALAKFTSGVVPGRQGVTVYRNTGQNSNANSTTLTVVRNKPWLFFADGVCPGGWTGTYSTQLVSQQKAGSSLSIMKKGETNSPWFSLSYVGAGEDTWYPDPNFVTYSGMLAVGLSTQLVGYIGPHSYDGNGAFIITSPYGVTSIAPYAQVDGQDSVLVPAPGGIEGIAKVCPNSQMAFVFDSSIGDYGQVTWASMV